MVNGCRHQSTGFDKIKQNYWKNHATLRLITTLLSLTVFATTKCIRNMNYFLFWIYECCCINKLGARNENRILFMCYFQKDPEGVLNHNQIDMHLYIYIYAIYRIGDTIKKDLKMSFCCHLIFHSIRWSSSWHT